MKPKLKNIPASVRQRLFNLAKEKNRPFGELLQYYAIERFLYRLSQSKYKDYVILKGALMFIVWDAPYSRATRDIDLLGKIKNNLEKLILMIKEVCEIKLDEDGMIFDSSSVTGEQIQEESEYKGLRIRFNGYLGQAKSFMQIDFGFGDAVFPNPIEIQYPTLLQMPRPQLKGYARETVIAEKFQAMVELDILNSRMKDFYDIWLLANQFDFDNQTLKNAIIKTFGKRDTAFNRDMQNFFDNFAQDEQKTTQWKAFIQKSRLLNAPKTLEEVIHALKDFLLPIIFGGTQKYDDLIWNAGGPWVKK